MEQTASQKKALKMVSCPVCGAKQFIPGDLAPLGTVACTKCQASVMMPMMLRQYELRSEIASGGMGTVYRAWDTALGREVAVKLMKQEFAEDPAAVNNFAVEARACAQINHTNIIHIYTFDYHEGLRFLAMEIADAGSLDSRIEAEKTLPELDVLDIGAIAEIAHRGGARLIVDNVFATPIWQSPLALFPSFSRSSSFYHTTSSYVARCARLG